MHCRRQKTHKNNKYRGKYTNFIVDVLRSSKTTDCFMDCVLKQLNYSEMSGVQANIAG